MEGHIGDQRSKAVMRYLDRLKKSVRRECIAESGAFARRRFWRSRCWALSMRGLSA